jgi:hypothetical protein
MIRNNTDFRIICGGSCLFFSLGLSWLFEACLVSPSIMPLCADWRSLQFIPYSVAWLASDTPHAVNLPVFWLMFAMQWFLVGTVVVSRIVQYFCHVADLLCDQTAEQPPYRVFDV